MLDRFSQLAAIQSQVAIVQVVLMIAGIALLVGGIGVMNIMFVSRQNEPVKSVFEKPWATRGNILMQFVIESGVEKRLAVWLGLFSSSYRGIYRS